MKFEGLKRTAKKLIASVLSASMLLVAAPAVISATETASDLDANLVTHYDFLGFTQGEQLQDKAPAGSSADHLTTLSGKASIANGVATVPAGSAISTANTGDLKGLTSMTFFMEFKADYVLNSAVWADLAVIKDSSAYAMRLVVNNTTGAFQAITGGKALGVAADVDSSNAAFAGNWMRIAVVYSYNEAAANHSVTFYGSQNGTDWTSLTGTYAASFANVNELRLSLGLDRGLSLQIKDVRIYNKALTEAEVKSIAPEEYVARTADDYLVTHYDFLGTTQTEQLADKATNGTALDPLTTINGDVKIENGVMTIPQGGRAFTTKVPDINAMTDAITVFMEFKADYVLNTAAWANLFLITNSSGNTARMAVTPASGAFQVVGTGWSGATGAMADTDPNNAAFAGNWLRLAYVAVYDATAQTAVITLYYSTDGGATWATATGKQTGTMFSTANGFALGLNLERGLDLQFKDVRIYSAALNEEQIKAITPEEYKEKTVADYLVTKYDFEGVTDADKMGDKAANGTKEVLTTLQGTASVGNGLASIPAGSAIYTNNVSDIKAATNSLTVFMEFKADYVLNSQAWADVMVIAGSSNTARLCVNPADGTFRAVGSGTQAKAIGQAEVDPDNHPYAGDWIRLAYVIDYNAETQKAILTIHASVDGGKTWTSVSDAASGEMFANATQFRLGLAVDRGLSMLVNEVQIYSTALTADEIHAITTTAPEAVINRGVQLSTGANAGSKLRLVAEVLGAEYQAAGFKVTAAWNGQSGASAEQDLACHYLYTALSAEDASGSIGAVTPAGGYYLIAVIVDEIPADLEGLTFTFTPYAVGADGEEALFTGAQFIYNVSTATVTVA